MSFLSKLKTESKSINTQTIYNLISTVILGGINIITMPLFTRLLDTTQYGLFALFYSWVAIFSCFMTFGAASGIGAAGYTYDSERYKEYQSSALTLSLCGCALFSVLFLLFREPISKLLKFSPYVVGLLLICTTAFSVVNYRQMVLIYEKKARSNCILSVSVAAATLALSLILYLYVPKDAQYMSRVYGMTIPYCVAAIPIIIGFYCRNKTLYNKEYWSFAFVFGLPVVFHSLSNNILGQSDRIMLQWLGYAGASVGIYSFFHTFTSIVQMLLTGLNTSWCPFYYDDLAANDEVKLKSKSRNYIEIFTVLCCGFILLSREVAMFFSKNEYWEGMDLIPIFVISIFFTFMYQFAVNFEFFHKKTTPMAIGTCVAGLINIGLNYLLIPGYGMIGAAVATMISHGALFIIHYIVVRNFKTASFNMRIPDFLPGLGCVILAGAGFVIFKNQWYVRWLAGAMIGVFEILRLYKRKTIF